VATINRVSSQLEVFLSVFESCLADCLKCSEPAEFAERSAIVAELASHTMATYILCQSMLLLAQRRCPESPGRIMLTRIAEDIEAYTIER
jgi:hypothetical protein